MPESVERKFQYADRNYIESMFCKCWGCPTSFTKDKIIAEKDNAIIIIRNGPKEISMRCKGVKKSGTKYHELISALKSNKLIPIESDVTLYIKGKFSWELVEEIQDSFMPSDSILIVTQGISKKLIRKNRRRRKLNH